MRIINELILNNADASVPQTSLNGLLANAFGYSIQIEITGNVIGTLQLNGSDDDVPESNFSAATYAVTNWTPIDNSQRAVTGAGSITYNVNDAMYNWVQVVFTPASGTGTITARFNAKGF